MTIDTLQVDCDSIRATFNEWRTEQELFDAQLSESLSALAAYQSHLDAWQKQLAGERDELRRAREQFEHQRAAAEGSQSGAHGSAEGNDDLSAAQERISALSASLLARTEELRVMDERRSELVAELDSQRALQKELRAALDEQKQTLEQERAHRAEELRSLERLKQGADGGPAEKHSEQRAAHDGQPKVNENPVLGSIVEQFGKLRQQRAMDRQVLRKTR